MNSNTSSRLSSNGSGLQSLNTKISNTVIDYSPWVRQQRPSSSKAAERKPKLPTIIEPPNIVHEENKCSELCRHLRRKPPEPLLIPDNPAKIQWLTVQLRMHQTRIETFLQREDELKETNAKLRESISNTERSSYGTVEANLHRFDQYKKTISLVETKQNEEKQELLNALIHERQQLANEVEMYENQVVSLDNQISDCQQLLKQLKTYKDIEYPEKERILQKLLQDIEETNLFNSEEVDEITRILKKQEQKYLEDLRLTVARLREEQATSAFSNVHKSYFLVSLDNDRMREEIAIQEEKIRLMEIENEHIRKLNTQLKHQQTKAFDSRTLFPHVFRQTTMPICTPDMDIVLDIPERQPPLPV
ncbi:unnamed protein product [Adineta steineri]|uniref:Uncharacterized protein n=1 Tax=Adineta steineri TaxID=433720 RepID=A0A814CNP5_9BILA|nr:unnamed protein product [Adineta steineri]CAF0945854.1 unnamed protein product [Adineta steineri]